MGVIESNPKILGGTPCFAGTRVPAESLFDHLRAGHTIDGFLEQSPTVGREQLVAVLEVPAGPDRYAIAWRKIMPMLNPHQSLRIERA